ncbi:hypothetical protein D3C76_494810 [compost metagenome]
MSMNSLSPKLLRVRGQITWSKDFRAEWLWKRCAGNADTENGSAALLNKEMNYNVEKEQASRLWIAHEACSFCLVMELPLGRDTAKSAIRIFRRVINSYLSNAGSMCGTSPSSAARFRRTEMAP